MSVWEQLYNPLNNIWLSAAIAAIPIVLFIVMLVFVKLKGYVAGGLSVLVAGAVALFVYKMPAAMVAAAAVYGVLAGIWPVASIVLAAIFLYKITVKTGQFTIIKNSISSVTEDHRIQVLLVAFSFGAFLEGAAGFGAPVAITAAILVGLGYRPLYAAGLCLIANIAGGAYGAMGIPVTIPALLTGLNGLSVARYTALVLPLVSFMIAFLLIFIVDGFKGIRQTFPAILVSGGSFSLTQAFVLYFLGAELADIFSAIVSLLALILLLRVWKPKEIYQVKRSENNSETATDAYPVNKIIFAWLPFILLTVFVTLFNLSFIKKLFEAGGPLNKLVLLFPIPGLNNLVIRHTPVVPERSPYPAVFKLDLFSSTTTAIVLAIIFTLLILHCDRKLIKETAVETGKELISPILTICSVLAFAYICMYSGMSSALGLAFASSGKIFPLFSPILGWLGVFLTGSVVNSGSLFAPLQSVTATQIGILPETMVAVNVMGGTMAKMISPQSIAVAAAAVGLVGKDNELFKFTIKYSLVLLILIGFISWFIF
jgi:lactate permease